jgi:hypothetical protein
MAVLKFKQLPWPFGFICCHGCLPMSCTDITIWKVDGIQVQFVETPSVESFYLKVQDISPFSVVILVYCMSTRGQYCPFFKRSKLWKVHSCWGQGKKREYFSLVWKWNHKKKNFFFKVEENGTICHFKVQLYKKIY